jgi:hypothetical protein
MGFRLVTGILPDCCEFGENRRDRVERSPRSNGTWSKPFPVPAFETDTLPGAVSGGVGGVDPVGFAALRPTLRAAFAGGQYGSKRSESCNGDPVGLATLRPTLQSLLWPSGRRCYQREKFPARGPSHGKVARLLALGIVSD